MESTFVLAFLFLFHFSPGGTYETYCSSGERLHTPREGHDVCLPCHHGTFIAEENHFFRECKPCATIENPDVEVLVSACNSTHDAVIICTYGFYRYRARNVRQKDRCEKCTECPFPARPCEGYYDTVCCLSNQDAVMAPGGVFVCKDRPIVCGAGQFFRTYSEECLPCPAGTYMSDHSHTYKDCLTCEELSENNLAQAVITRPCSRTAPTLFGCKAGYFRDPAQESLQIEFPCTPCRICNRSLVDCGMFHDAVCDDQDRKIATAAIDHPVVIDTREVVTMIKQLNATFNESVHSCILDCMAEGFAALKVNISQSESSNRKCMSSCFPEIHEAYKSAWFSAISYIALFVSCNFLVWFITKKIDPENMRKWHLHIWRFTHVVFVANVIGIILFIIKTLLIIRVIEDRGYGVVTITLLCCVFFVLNLTLLLIFMKNVHEKKYS